MAMDFQILLPGVPARSDRGALGWCSVVLIRAGDRNILFDTGSPGDRQPLLRSLTEAGVKPGEVDTVFLSHGHYDHVLNVPLFSRADILISRTEWDYLSNGGWQAAGDPFVSELFLEWAASRVGLVSGDEEIAPGVHTLALPGHTPGLTGLRLDSLGVLLASDAVKNAHEYVSRTPPPVFHSEEAALESYQIAAGAAEIIVCGHDRPFRPDADGTAVYVDQWTVEVETADDPHGPVRRLRIM